jgi:hypothetical protein
MFKSIDRRAEKVIGAMGRAVGGTGLRSTNEIAIVPESDGIFILCG